MAKQGVFLDSATHVTIPSLSTVSGLAFSSLDANLWHATTDTSAGHATYPAYDGSRIQSVPTNPNNNLVFAFSNGTTTNSGNYDVPGGAYGSLITQPFSLVGYSAADVPTLYFDYLLAGGSTANYDTARVFASDDGVTWHLLGATLSNPNGDLPSTVDGSGNAQWEQFRLAPPAVPEHYNNHLDVYTWSLGDFVGESSVRLRFDFSSAGDMHVGDTGNPGETVGAYLGALSGEQLYDGATFTVADATGLNDVTFEFDMGVELDLLNVTASVVTDSNGDPIGDRVNLFGASRVVTLDTLSSTEGGHAQTLVHDSHADDFHGDLSVPAGAGDTPDPSDTTYYVWNQ